MIKKKSKKPYFSIITVVKDDEKNIQKTIMSVLSQSFKNYEYILIDGKSIDHTLNVINKFKKKLNVIISEKDKGLYFAMNKGIKFSKGNIIVFVNSGDLLTKNALKIIHNKFIIKPKIDFIFGTVKRHYTNTTILKHGYNTNRLKYNFDFATSHSTAFFIKLKSLKGIGYFNTKYKCSADYDFYYKAIITKKLKGDVTNKKQLIGIVKSGGYSSKISFFEHLFEESKIRIKNNQNIFFVFLIYCNAIIKHLLKKTIFK